MRKSCTGKEPRHTKSTRVYQPVVKENRNIKKVLGKASNSLRCLCLKDIYSLYGTLKIAVNLMNKVIQ